jgi:predicted nucleic acid-binding protein
MSTQTYLIDTNVIIGLEDNHAVQPAFAALLNIASKHKIDVIVHEAARDDILRDRDANRRQISLSKLDKFLSIKKVRGLDRTELERKFGPLIRPNDVVDATLLDSIERGTADFLVTEDRKLHERARRFSPELGRRGHVADAVHLLRQL